MSQNYLEEKKYSGSPEVVEVSSASFETGSVIQDDAYLRKTHRNLRPRHIHLIAIGGSIGTGLFVTIGSGLMHGGPANLFIGYLLYSILVGIVSFTIGELICYMPTDSPFISFAGRVIDPAFEFTVGYNFWIMISLYIPFEITSVNSMIHFWSDNYTPVAEFIPHLASYVALNIFAVRYYGESEFVLAMGKLILAIGLLFFTFVTMVGGNPAHDAFGFRYWNTPGPFNEYLATGSMGKFHAWFFALSNGVFTIVGPEYLGMVAGETENPRQTLPVAFRSVPYRLTIFFVGGALSVGVLVAFNDPTLVNNIANGASGANVSPYVIAMKNLNIRVLPHIVNVLCISSAYSAGNSYMYCSSRALYALSRKGMAPKIFSWCTKSGVPIPALGLATCFGFLCFLELGSTAKVAFNWMINLSTGCQVVNYLFMMITYVGFYRACKAQGIDRTAMPLQSFLTRLQPYPAYFAGFFCFLIVFFLGYQSFIPSFDIDSFLYYYLIVFVDIALFVLWKVVKRTKFVKAIDADISSGLDEIESHESDYYDQRDKKGLTSEKTWYGKIIDWLL